jgi:DNA repair exonuclease SbcCD ATPase subunit
MEQSLSNRIAVFRNGRTRIEQQLENERTTITRLTNRIDRLKEESAQLVKAVGLIDKCIEIVSANGIGKIESVVSAGLHRVFNDKTLALVVEKKETARGYSYRLLIKHGDTVGNPMDSFGGGVQNVVAFLLRIIFIKRFKLAKLVALDEVFANVSVDYINFVTNVSAMLKTLSEDHGFTILAVTQVAELTEAARHVYEVVPTSPPTLREQVSISEVGEPDETDKAEIS